MKKLPIILVLLSFLLLDGCKQQTATGSEAVPSAQIPVTSSMKPSYQLPWSSGGATEFMSYEDYFSKNRPYDDEDVVWGWSLPGVDLEYDGSVLRLIDTSTNKALWDIISLPNCNWVTADLNWIYGITSQSELVRVSYSGEERQVLYTDQSGLLWALSIAEDIFAPVYLADGCALFFLAGADDGIGIYRLYLPDQTLDILYDAIPTDAIQLFMSAPISNVEVRWSQGNPDFFARYEALTNDPNSGYDPQKIGESECIGMVELDFDMYSASEYYYNTITGDLYEMPFGYVYLEMPRTKENIEKNGASWWLDFQ